MRKRAILGCLARHQEWEDDGNTATRRFSDGRCFVGLTTQITGRNIRAARFRQLLRTRSLPGADSLGFGEKRARRAKLVRYEQFAESVGRSLIAPPS
jgi:hypothetical protein